MHSQPNYLSERLLTLSRDAQLQAAVAAIAPGRFRRDLTDARYQARVCYTKALRRFVYDGAAFEEILATPDLKLLFFRTFGYKGSMNFTLYPDCWIKDLPLLEFGEKAYLADGVVLGTNQVSHDQEFITVAGITVESLAVIDQEVMLGYGSRIGEGCAISVRCIIGMRSQLGAGTSMAPRSTVGHHCHVGEFAQIGHEAFIGNFSQVDSRVVVPDYTKIPQFSRVTNEGVFPRRRGSRTSPAASPSSANSIWREAGAGGPLS